MAKEIEPSGTCGQGSLALDGQTLANLEVLENGMGGTEGTLLRYLDHCRHPPPCDLVHSCFVAISRVLVALIPRSSRGRCARNAARPSGSACSEPGSAALSATLPPSAPALTPW